jgi:hypothetical protein
VIARIAIWGLFDSKTTIEELQEGLPALERPSEWIWSESGERFGIIAFGEDLTEAFGWARDLIGSDPDVYEEFDTVDV